MSYRYPRVVRPLLASAILLVPVQAWALSTGSEPQAQNVASLDNGSGDEIIVTATKRPQALKDVPMSVDVQTGKDLQQYKILDIKDIGQLAPGLQISNSNGRQNLASVRGISFNPDTGGPASIAVYLNEIPVDIQTVTTGLYDISQIEVLRGPQGTLRGRTAPAGAITITSRTANLDHAEGYVQGTLGSLNSQNLQGGVSLPIVPGTVAVRVAGLIDRNRVNDVFDINRNEHSSSKSESFRVTLSFKSPDSVVSGNLTYQYLDSRTNVLRQVFGSGARPSPLSPDITGPAITIRDRLAVQEGPTINNNRTDFLSGNQTIDLGNHTISLLEGYQNTRLVSLTDLDIGNIVKNYNQLQDVPIKQKSLTGEARLSSNWSGAINYVLGVFYNRSTNDADTNLLLNTFFAGGGVALPPSVFRLPLAARTVISNNSTDLAVFGDVRADLTSKLKLDVGVRYTRNSGTAQSFLTVSSPGAKLPGFPAIPAFVSPNNQATVLPQFVTRVFHPLTGTASLSYKASDNLTAYVTYGRSYRRGTAQLGVNTPLDPSLLVLDPERSDSVEAGIKTQFLDRRASLNISAFYQKFDGYIDLATVNVAPNRDGVVNSSGTTVSYNGAASTRGVEIQFDARPTNYWDIGINASYSDAHFDNARVPCNDYNHDGKPDSVGTPFVPVGQQVSFCLRNDPLAVISKFALNATSEVRSDIGFSQAFVRGLFTYRPAFTSDAANYRFPSVANLNLYVGLRGIGSGWELTGFIKNLFNTVQVQTVGGGQIQYGTGKTSPPLLSGYRAISIAPPREFGVSASYSF